MSTASRRLIFNQPDPAIGVGHARTSNTSSPPPAAAPTLPTVTGGKRSAGTDGINRQQSNRNTVPRICTQHIAIGSYREADAECDTDAEPSAQSKPARHWQLSASRAAARTPVDTSDKSYFLHHAYQAGTEQLPKISKSLPVVPRNRKLYLTTSPLRVQLQKSPSSDEQPIGTPHIRTLYQSIY